MARSIEIHNDMSLRQRFLHINWGLVGLVVVIASIGFAALYSAAGGSFDPWASRQIARFVFGMAIMIGITVTDIRLWHRLAYIFYACGLLLLVIVEIKGHIGMGAQRWINLGFMRLQPSELMKLAVIMALARYFHRIDGSDARRILLLLPAAGMILLPVGLVLVQPDLGTAGTILLAGAAVFFVAGAPLWLFIGGIAAGLAALPVAWHFLHDYQKQRILTFMNPESDPLGAGYHIMQSKIALGSGGFGGRGFLKGTQSHLNFLPEKQTDFIFTLWAEEWGLIGGIILLLLFGAVFVYCGWIALRCRHAFGRIMAFGLMVNFSLYVLINVSMVMGLIPVVGVPLPLVSYGGTAMLSVLIGFGLIMSCHVHRDAKVPRGW